MLACAYKLGLATPSTTKSAQEQCNDMCMVVFSFNQSNAIVDAQNLMRQPRCARACGNPAGFYKHCYALSADADVIAACSFQAGLKDRNPSTPTPVTRPPTGEMKGGFFVVSDLTT